MLLNAVMLGLALVVALLLGRARGRGPGQRAGIRASLVAFGVLVVLTVVFDNLMIWAGLFTYGDHHLSGLRLGLAPVEDLAYPLGAVILLPALWLWWTRAARR